MVGVILFQCTRDRMILKQSHLGSFNFKCKNIWLNKKLKILKNIFSVKTNAFKSHSKPSEYLFMFILIWFKTQKHIQWYINSFLLC